MSYVIPIYPEIFLLLAICVIETFDLLSKKKDSQTIYLLSQATLFGLIILTATKFGKSPEAVFYGHFISDNLAVVLKIAIAFVSMLALLYTRDYITHRQFMRSEYYLLFLFAVLGMYVLVSGSSLLSIYLGLELLSLASYALVAMRRDSRDASEAGIKYFVMGAIASGFLLYGISILYGVTGTIIISEIASNISTNQLLTENKLLLSFALVFIVAGLAFKLGAVPFHMWLPDIYQGAPTSVIVFISSAPKIAAFGMLIRLLVEAVPQLNDQWQQLLVVLCVLSMAVGNISAIVQSNLKRMLAYSAIAHVGYFLLGIIAGTQDGYSASMFYIIVYSIMTAAGFGLIIFMARQNEEFDEIRQFAGLWRVSPWYAVVTLFIMMSMAGIPPFIGFWPKLEVISAVLNSGLPYGTHLAIAAVFFSIIGAYYYLMVCKTVFFDEPDENLTLEAPRDVRIALSLNGTFLLLLGIFPSSLLNYCILVFSS